jgi:hypothetical protein
MKRILFTLLLTVAVARVSPAQFHNNGIFRETLSFPVQMVVAGTTAVPAVFQTTNVIWKVSLSLPVSMVVPSTTDAPDVILHKTLTGNDVINLALGRPLGSKVDAKKEVLALDVMVGTPTGAQFPTSQLVIYDTTKTPNDDTAITKVLGQNATLDWQTAFSGKTADTGFGITTGMLNASGTAQNGLSSSSLYAAGTASCAHTPTTTPAKAAATGALFIEGHLTFVCTDTKGTHTFDGIVQAGSIKVTGAPLGFYSTTGFAVMPGKQGTIVKKTVTGTDLVNLTLGRPLSTKLNAETEVLALNATFETHGQPPQSEVVIYDSTKNGAAGITQVLAAYGTLDWQNAYLNSTNSGFGVATGTIKAAGTAQNGLSDSDFQGAGAAAGKHLYIVHDANASPTATGVIQGHLKFVYTDATGTHNFDGIYLKGTGHVSGKPIGGY